MSYLSVCSLKKGLALKICTRFVLSKWNHILFNLLCVWILFRNAGSQRCFGFPWTELTWSQLSLYSILLQMNAHHHYPPLPIRWWWGHSTPRRWGIAVHRSHPPQTVCPPGDTTPLHLVVSWWERCWSTGLSLGHSCQHKNDMTMTRHCVKHWKTSKDQKLSSLEFLNVYGHISSITYLSPFFLGKQQGYCWGFVSKYRRPCHKQVQKQIHWKMLLHNVQLLNQNPLWLLVAYSELDMLNTCTYRSALS